MAVATSEEEQVSEAIPQRSKGALEPGTPTRLAELVEYAPGAVVSRTLAKSEAGTLTVFAFDRGEALSEHTTPFDAYVQVLDGRAELVIGGESVLAQAGETVVMPADVPHAVKAIQRFKMLLIMLRG
jgi:quercetin dioxygenase-like cupin family protein